MKLFRNARVIPYLTEGFSGSLADLLVEGRFVKAILPVGTADCPEETEILDLHGKTVLPGLFDLHMHLYFSTEDFHVLGAKSQNEYVFDAIRYAGEFLRQGFTTIRDCGNVFDIGIALRDAVVAGTVPGPRIFTAGKCLTPTAKGNSTFPNLYDEVNTPEEILKAVRKEHAKGVDFIKYMATGSVANLNGEPGELITTRAEVFALQAAAESVGKYAGVHCHGKEGILLCAEAGIRTVEHASMMDDECIELILRKGGKTSIVPTLDPVVQLHRGHECGALPPALFRKIDQVYAHAADLVRATRAGVLTGWGTDSSCSFYARNVGYEFDVRREVGYTNEEILKQATINSARILGLEDCLGTLRAGKLADLVIVEGNPDEDILAMCRYPWAVYLEGRRCY
ncbi:MAG: amidohydrolase family protein [Oscillospiraceae bacterium]|nr:amidohydrolase family protein [Oscillospiraceae bacterium]